MTDDEIARIAAAVWDSPSMPKGMSPAEFAAAVRAAIYPDPPVALKSVRVRAPRAMRFEVTVYSDLTATAVELKDELMGGD